MTLIDGDGDGGLAAALAGWSAPDRCPDTITVLDLATGDTQVQIPRAHDELSITALAAGRARNRLMLLSGGERGVVRRWDLRTGRPAGDPWQAYELMGCVGAYSVNTVALGEPDGRPVAAAGGWDGEVRLWDVERGGTGENLEDPGDADQSHREQADSAGEPDIGDDDGTVRALAFTSLAAGPALAAADSTGMVRLWDLRTRTVARRLQAGNP